MKNLKESMVMSPGSPSMAYEAGYVTLHEPKAVIETWASSEAAFGSGFEDL